MADHRRDYRDRALKASWDKKKIDVSKSEENNNFNKEAYDELMKYAKELEEKKKNN